MTKLDRLVRSSLDFARLLERARRDGWQLLALDTPEAHTPMGEAMQWMAAVFGRLEARLISQRTREALAVARSRGVRLGRPPAVSDELVRLAVRLHRNGWSARETAMYLEAAGIAAPRGGTAWHPSTVARILRREGLTLRRGRYPMRRRRGSAAAARAVENLRRSG